MRLWGVVAVAVTALWTCSASAQVLRISDDRGGVIDNYVAHYQTVRQSGEEVRIDGVCLSACTLVLGIVPPNRVCATPNAALGFHAAYLMVGDGQRVPAASQTRRMLNIYPSNIRRWIAHHGGLRPQMIFLAGRELTQLVRPCGVTRTASGL